MPSQVQFELLATHVNRLQAVVADLCKKIEALEATVAVLQPVVDAIKKSP